MAEKGVFIVDRVVQELMNGGVDLQKNIWYIPVSEHDLTVELYKTNLKSSQNI
jgi:hypothetical protein